MEESILNNCGLMILQQLGLSKQGQLAVNKVRKVEQESRQKSLATFGKIDENNLTKPLLGVET